MSISSKTQNLCSIFFLQYCLGGHFCLHVTSRKSEVSGWACPAADLPRTRVRLTDDVTASSQWANFCHAKTGQAFCLKSDLSLWHAKMRPMYVYVCICIYIYIYIYIYTNIYVHIWLPQITTTFIKNIKAHDNLLQFPERDPTDINYQEY